MKKIAIFLADLSGGGGERVQLALAREWVSQGFAVELVVMRRIGELMPVVPPGVTVYSLDCIRVRQCVNLLGCYLRKTRPNALLAAMWPMTVVAILAHRLAGSEARTGISEHTVMSHSHEAQGSRRRFLVRLSIALTYPLADARVAVSDGVANDLAGLGWLDRRRITVIYNPAAQGNSKTIADVHDPWAPLGGKRVISVGSLRDAKDHALLIRAFSLVRQKIDASLVILGEGSERPKLLRLIEELGLGDEVKLPGFVLDPYPWYLEADLFVLSSKYEGFGNVIVEAMECGLPIVSTDCPSGPREILDDGRFGRLVPIGNADALAIAILETVSETSSPEKQKKRAADFGVDRASRAYLELLI